jgi:hypothetical protein
VATVPRGAHLAIGSSAFSRRRGRPVRAVHATEDRPCPHLSPGAARHAGGDRRSASVAGTQGLPCDLGGAAGRRALTLFHRRDLNRAARPPARLIRTLENLLRWLRAVCVWLLLEPRLLWLTILVLLRAAVTVGWRDSEQSYRVTGMLLQLFGIITVACGIRGNMKLFGRPGPMGLTILWWDRRPRYHPQTFKFSQSDTIDATDSFTAEVWAGGPGAAIEVRLLVV